MRMAHAQRVFLMHPVSLLILQNAIDYKMHQFHEYLFGTSLYKKALIVHSKTSLKHRIKMTK